MARARDNPQAWNEVLIALENNDVKTARQIVIKYEFGKDVSSKHTYYCKSPRGEVTMFLDMKAIAKYFGMSVPGMKGRFTRQAYTWAEGKFKGYEIWRELNPGEDEYL